jgi:putative tributyrin esterase
MALVRCDFFSDVLGLSTSMTVILPQQTSSQIGMRGSASGAAPPTLYLMTTRSGSGVRRSNATSLRSAWR